MTSEQIRKIILEGSKRALDKLIRQQQVVDGYLIFSEGGKPVKVWARDIQIDD